MSEWKCSGKSLISVSCMWARKNSEGTPLSTSKSLPRPRYFRPANPSYEKVFLMDPLPPDRPKISIGLNPFPEEMPLLASNGISFDCTNRSARLVGLHSAFRTCYRSFRRYRFSCNNLIDCILSEIRTVSYLNLTFLCFCYILYQQCRVFRDGRCKLSISETAVLKKWSAMKWFTHSRWMKLTRSLAAT